MPNCKLIFLEFTDFTFLLHRLLIICLLLKLSCWLYNVLTYAGLKLLQEPPRTSGGLLLGRAALGKVLFIVCSQHGPVRQKDRQIIIHFWVLVQDPNHLSHLANEKCVAADRSKQGDDGRNNIETGTCGLFRVIDSREEVRRVREESMRDSQLSYVTVRAKLYANDPVLLLETDEDAAIRVRTEAKFRIRKSYWT